MVTMQWSYGAIACVCWGNCVCSVQLLSKLVFCSRRKRSGKIRVRLDFIEMETHCHARWMQSRIDVCVCVLFFYIRAHNQRAFGWNMSPFVQYLKWTFRTSYCDSFEFNFELAMIHIPSTWKPNRFFLFSTQLYSECETASFFLTL